MKPPRRQLDQEQRLAGEVTDAERTAVAEVMAEAYTPEAVIARQRQIIHLLRGVRALGIALVALLVVVGAAGIAVLDVSNDTRNTTRRLRDEQHTVLCDVYPVLDRTPPEHLDCR